MTHKLSFTAKELDRYKTLIFRQHQRELMAAKDEHYLRGLADGKRQAVNTMRVVLGLDEIPAE